MKQYVLNDVFIYHTRYIALSEIIAFILVGLETLCIDFVSQWVEAENNYYSRTLILRPPMGVSKSGLYSKVVFILRGRMVEPCRTTQNYSG